MALSQVETADTSECDHFLAIADSVMEVLPLQESDPVIMCVLVETMYSNGRQWLDRLEVSCALVQA